MQWDLRDEKHLLYRQNSVHRNSLRSLLAFSVARSLSVSHALVVPLAGPGGAAPVLIGNAVRQSTSGYKPGLLLTAVFITRSRITHDSLVSARMLAS